MNKRRLESVMKLHGDTGMTLAKCIGISRSRFSAKINESKGAGFTQREIAIIKQRYSLSSDEVVSIFFNQDVS